MENGPATQEPGARYGRRFLLMDALMLGVSAATLFLGIYFWIREGMVGFDAGR